MPTLWFDIMNIEYDDPDWSDLDEKPQVADVLPKEDRDELNDEIVD